MKPGEVHTDFRIYNLVQALRRGDLREKKKAALALVGTSELSGLEALLDALHEHNPELRTVAAHALVGCQNRYVQAALRGFLKHQQWFVREAAAAALSGTGDYETAEALVERFRDEFPSVSRAASLALRSCGNNRILRMLVDLLSSPEHIVAQRAAQSLQGRRELRIVERIASMVSPEVKSEIALMAVSALKGTRIAAGLLALKEALLSSSAAVRAQAADSLEGTHYQPALDLLIGLLADRSSSVVKATLRALAQTDYPPAVAALIAILRGKHSPAIKVLAINALRCNRDAKVVSALLECLMHCQDEQLREAATDGLDWRYSSAVKVALEDLAINSKQAPLRISALTRLNGCTDQNSLSLFSRLALLDSDLNVRQQAMINLKDFSCQWTRGIAARLLADPYWRADEIAIRQIAAEILENCDDGSSCQALAQGLARETSVTVRESICNSFVQHSCQTASQSLIAATQDKHPSVRVIAVKALSRRADDQSLRCLIGRLLADSSSEVREESARGLKGRTNVLALAGLVYSVLDQSPMVRAAALEALKGEIGLRIVELSDSRLSAQSGDLQFSLMRIMNGTANRRTVISVVKMLLQEALSDGQLNSSRPDSVQCHNNISFDQKLIGPEEELARLDLLNALQVE